MKYIVLFLITIQINSALAQGHYGRFWRGESKKSYPELRNYCDDRHSDCFIELINRWLIPATPSYAAKDALVGYAPVLLPKSLQDKYHDEVALILYSNESDYRRLRNDNTNLEGSTYGPIHQDIFEMGEKSTVESSRSLVPEKLRKLELVDINPNTGLKEVSFDVTDQRSSITHSIGFFQLIEKKDSKTSKFIKRINVHLSAINKTKKMYGITGSYALVTEDYAMVYVFVEPKKAPRFKKSLLYNNYALNIVWSTELKSLNPIQRSPLLYERIGYAQGGNLIFEPGVKPGKADHYRLHIK